MEDESELKMVNKVPRANVPRAEDSSIRTEPLCLLHSIRPWRFQIFGWTILNDSSTTGTGRNCNRTSPRTQQRGLKGGYELE